MFNFFNISKDQNEQGIEQENMSLAEKNQQMRNDQYNSANKAPVHGENGVCCGGCGGS